MKACLFMLLTGVVAGILLAPEKGAVTRKKLTDGWKDLKDGLNNQMENFAGKIETVAEGIDETAQPSA